MLFSVSHHDCQILNWFFSYSIWRPYVLASSNTFRFEFCDTRVVSSSFFFVFSIFSLYLISLLCCFSFSCARFSFFFFFFVFLCSCSCLRYSFQIHINTLLKVTMEFNWIGFCFLFEHLFFFYLIKLRNEERKTRCRVVSLSVLFWYRKSQIDLWLIDWFLLNIRLTPFLIDKNFWRCFSRIICK